MLKYFFSLALVFFFLNSFAQNDFRPGFYVTNQMDTVKGFIHYYPTIKGNDPCYFKKAPNEQLQKFTPAEIKGFGYVNDKYVESKILDSTQASQKVFTEVLVDGRVSLLTHNERFFIEKDGKIYHLFITSKDTLIQGVRHKSLSKHHLGILNYALFECDKSKARIAKITLAERPLTLLVEQYNKCVGAQFTSYKAGKRWMTASYEFGIGATSSKVNYTRLSTGTSVYPELNFTSSFLPIYGLNINLASPRISENFSTNLGVYYVSSNYTAFTMFGSTRRDYFYKSSELKIPVGFRYTARVNKAVSPFFNFGVAKNILLSEEGDGGFTTSRNHGGFYGGAGTHFKLKNNLGGFIEFRYEYTSNIGNTAHLTRGLQGHVTNLHTLVGIRLK